jgi:hypothetical protein
MFDNVAIDVASLANGRDIFLSQMLFMSIVCADTVIVGHGLNNAMKGINMQHAQVIGASLCDHIE